MSMRSLVFQQWTAYLVVVAMLFGMAAPVAVCRCVDCNCPKSKAWFMPKSATDSTGTGNTKCNCLPVTEDRCTSEIPCPCQCCDIQHDDKIASEAVLTERVHFNPSQDIVSVLPVGFASVSGLPFRSDSPRILLSPHVPLHVLLCVFLN